MGHLARCRRSKRLLLVPCFSSRAAGGLSGARRRASAGFSRRCCSFVRLDIKASDHQLDFTCHCCEFPRKVRMKTCFGGNTMTSSHLPHLDSGMRFFAVAFLIATSTGTCQAGASSKRGLSEAVTWGNYFCGDLSQALGTPQSISWTYSWGPEPPAPCAQLGSGLADFAPMVWGQKSVNATLNFTAGVRFLLGFNEPNGAKQSDLTPAEAAALWPSVAAMAKAAGLSLVSPAPAGNGVSWLDSFFSLCSGCLADIVAVAQHTYVCTGPALQQALGMYTKYGKPIWVTEFNCGDGARNASAAEHLAYMKAALPILDAAPHVERYAWMSGRNNKVPGAALFSGAAGSATELGRFYLGL